MDPQTRECQRVVDGPVVRHLEKRREGSCAFADRVAQVSLDTYRAAVAGSGNPSPTCVSTIVAHFEDTDELDVLSLGVGTKFIKQETLQNGYDLKRVRDCHSEVLARRAFQCYLLTEIESGEPRILLSKGPKDFELNPNVTLHLYASSAPCGNATIKKYGQMIKERFDDKLPANQWKDQPHEPIPAHSLHLGQFALLVKADPSCNDQGAESPPLRYGKKKAYLSGNDTACPPGTSYHRGNLHTCSDKILRWNCLGLQGTLLTCLLPCPLTLTSITVGRKFTSAMSRRAVCCRGLGAFEPYWGRNKRKRPDNVNISDDDDNVKPSASPYKLMHPAIMGTGVYMNPTDTLDMGRKEEQHVGQDVTFQDNLAYVWCPLWETAECIDTISGFIAGQQNNQPSEVSTFCQARRILASLEDGPQPAKDLSLKDLVDLKRKRCPKHEAAKDELLTQHFVFSDWKRRRSALNEPVSGGNDKRE